MEKLTADKLAETEKQLYESRTSIMLSQIQPHFLYNALGTIRALCLTDADKARTAIDCFSKYLRGNLDSLTKSKLISFKEELSHLENYIYIEKLRFGKKLCIKYELSVTEFSCPPLTLQPLVENAIKHGIMRKKEGGTVTVKSYFKDGFNIIEVSDDGIGFDPDSSVWQSGEHVGLANTRGRIKNLCNGTFEVTSKIGTGTVVTVKIAGEKVE